MLIDSHAHLNFSVFEKDLPEVIKRCREREMKVINVGSQIQTSKKAIEIAKNNDGFFAAVGIHPIHIGESERDKLETADSQEGWQKLSLKESFDKIRELAENKKVIAIGETGLDFFRLAGNQRKTKNLQKEYFLKQIDLAQKLGLPLILHCRGEKGNPYNAYSEILDIITGENLRGVIHCFGADENIAREFIGRGFLIGITGIVTFGKKAETIQMVAKNISLEKILIETDSPYLAPEPHRGERNEPVYVELVAQKIAELRGMSKEEVIEITGRNAINLFSL